MGEHRPCRERGRRWFRTVPVVLIVALGVLTGCADAPLPTPGAPLAPSSWSGTGELGEEGAAAVLTREPVLSGMDPDATDPDTGSGQGGAVPATSSGAAGPSRPAPGGQGGADAPRCRPDPGLRTYIVAGDDASSHRLMITNETGAACRLDGAPVVLVVLAETGREVGLPAEATREATTLRLPTGGTATARLEVADLGSDAAEWECTNLEIRGLNIYLPGSTTPTLAEVESVWPGFASACSGELPRSQLRIGPWQQA